MSHTSQRHIPAARLSILALPLLGMLFPQMQADIFGAYPVYSMVVIIMIHVFILVNSHSNCMKWVVTLNGWENGGSVSAEAGLDHDNLRGHQSLHTTYSHSIQHSAHDLTSSFNPGVPPWTAFPDYPIWGGIPVTVSLSWALHFRNSTKCHLILCCLFTLLLPLLISPNTLEYTLHKGRALFWSVYHHIPHTQKCTGRRIWVGLALSCLRCLMHQTFTEHKFCARHHTSFGNMKVNKSDGNTETLKATRVPCFSCCFQRIIEDPCS